MLGHFARYTYPQSDSPLELAMAFMPSTCLAVGDATGAWVSRHGDHALHPHQAAQLAVGQAATILGNILKLHDFLAAKPIAALFGTLLSCLRMRFFLRSRSFSRRSSASCAGTLAASDHPTPRAERRKPGPRIRRNLTPCQATRLRNANRILLEFVAV